MGEIEAKQLGERFSVVAIGDADAIMWLCGTDARGASHQIDGV